jgi:hypothetical protein
MENKMTRLNLMTQFSKTIVGGLLLFAFMLTGCGGGGAGTTTVTPPVTPPPSTIAAQETKTRIADAFTVQVTPYATSASAVPVRFEVSVTDDTKVTGTPTAYFGNDFETGIEVTPSKTSTGWSVAVPANMSAGKGLLLSFTLTNGDKFETGLSDFTF